MGTAARAPATAAKARCIPRGRNRLHTILDRHLGEFCDVYDERYAANYDIFRLERIRDVGERFLTCGDYALEWLASGAPIRTAHDTQSTAAVLPA